MLDASQPWLPLLDLGPTTARPARRARRTAATPALKPAPETSGKPATRPAREPDVGGASAGHARALRYAFLGLVARWDLTGPDTLTLLGEPLAGEGERLERLEALVGVSRLLLLLHPERERCRAFLRAPCPALGGDTPLKAMLAGGHPGVVQVRAHLAALARL